MTGRHSSETALDRYDLYELAVTDPPRLIRFLRAVHGREPRVLREDFSGSGALSRGWARLVPGSRAIAVDRDAEPLERAGRQPGVVTRRADVLRARDKADVIAAVNFPLGYSHTRNALLRYLRHARHCLKPRGIFVADTYGGADAFMTGTTKARLRGPGPGRSALRIDYTWEQRAADPVTGRVLNAMHFRIREPGRTRARVIRDAFVYDWRLWSIPELRDALAEAGFRRVEVYHRLGAAIDQDGRLIVRATQPGEDLGPSWVVYVVARR